MMVDLEREEYAFPGLEKTSESPPTQGIVFFMRVVVYCGFISSGFDLSKLPVNGPQKPIQGFPVQCMLL